MEKSNFHFWNSPLSFFGTLRWELEAGQINRIEPGQTARMCQLAYLYTDGKGYSLSVPAWWGLNDWKLISDIIKKWKHKTNQIFNMYEAMLIRFIILALMVWSSGEGIIYPTDLVVIHLSLLIQKACEIRSWSHVKKLVITSKLPRKAG